MISICFCHQKFLTDNKYEPASCFSKQVHATWDGGCGKTFTVHKKDFGKGECYCKFILVIHATDVQGRFADEHVTALSASAVKEGFPEPNIVLLITTEEGVGIKRIKVGAQEHPVFPWNVLDYLTKAIVEESRVPSVDEILGRFQAKEVLPAISILCQGWLAVYASANPDTGCEIVKAALENMGWRKMSSEYRRILATKGDTVQSAAWWRCLPMGELEQRVLKDYGAKDWSDQQATKRFLELIKTGISFGRAREVAEAYLSICTLLEDVAQ